MILCGYVVDNNMKTEPKYSSMAIVVAAVEAATKDISNYKNKLWYLRKYWDFGGIYKLTNCIGNSHKKE